MRSRTPLGAFVATLLLAAVAAAPAQAAETWTARLSGANELPARDTAARGVAVVQLSADGTELTYRLVVANIENVVASHIHLGTDEDNGPVVAFLYEGGAPGSGRVDGVIATGTITADDLIGPLAGQPLSALVDAITGDEAYVNVHTSDGVGGANTGPGDFAAGEIRGQLG